jgi:hypothetical protein
MANLNCYSGQVTNDKGREIRITAIGMDLNDSKKVKIFSTIIPLRDALPAMPKELMAGRKRDKTNVFSATGGLAAITQGNVTLSEKMATITVGDDLVFDLGASLGAPTRSVLKSMLTGEVFKSSASATSPIVTLGVAGNVVDTTGTCPSMVLGQDWKYLLKEDLRLIIPYGRGATKTNSFMDTASSTQIGIMVEYKTTYGSGKVSVSRYAGACGGDLQDISGDDMNKFSVNLDFYSDAREYSDYFINGGYDFDLDSATEIKNIMVSAIVTNSTPTAPSDFGTSGDLIALVDSDNGATVIKKSTGSAWVDITGFLVAGSKIFSKKKTATTIAAATTEWAYLSIKTGGGAVPATGTAIATTVTTESGTGYTLGATYVMPIMDYNFDTEAFLAYIG